MELNKFHQSNQSDTFENKVQQKKIYQKSTITFLMTIRFGILEMLTKK